MGEYQSEEEKKRKVLIINTGGTIGSKYTDKGIAIFNSQRSKSERSDRSIACGVRQVIARKLVSLKPKYGHTHHFVMENTNSPSLNKMSSPFHR